MLARNELDAEWRGALEHAGVSSDRARLYVVDSAKASDELTFEELAPVANDLSLPRKWP